MRVFVAVPEVDSDAIRNGDSAYLTTDADPNLRIEGRIVRNSNAIDHTTRTLNVEVDIDNANGEMRTGAYVFVHFRLPSSSRDVTVPSSTLLFRSEGLRVGVVRDDRVTLVPVTIGHDFGNTVEITSGLTVKDAVILNPSDSLTDGTEVHPQEAKTAGVRR